jgi:hypothetical protein
LRRIFAFEVTVGEGQSISKSEDSWYGFIWKVLPGAVAKALDAAHLVF